MAENDRQAARLNNVLSGLEVIISSGKDGRFTAYTLAEPLFFFERNSEAELQELITDTLRSYVNGFYKSLGEVRVEFRSTPEKTVDIPVERLTPVSRVRPFIRPTPEKERQLVRDFGTVKAVVDDAFIAAETRWHLTADGRWVVALAIIIPSAIVLLVLVFTLSKFGVTYGDHSPIEAPAAD